ncbi:MAG: alpha/beta fold hydrolase [Pseudomonadota bacterium]
MPIKIEKITFNYLDWQANAFKILPLGEDQQKDALAIFTHGYTGHKGQIVNWGTLLAEQGIPSLVFDLPGHYLGSFNEVQDFRKFKAHAHELFSEIFRITGAVLHKSTLILGGHSLGAFLALKALSLPVFATHRKLAICVGLGLQAMDTKHILETPYFKTVLDWRSQLVSPALGPDNIFPWPKEEKNTLSTFGQRVHLICGEDDVAVGPTGAEEMKLLLESLHNRVTLEKLARLPHHQPELAAVLIKNFIQKEGLF